MNLLGKILTLLIFVMSLAFLFVAFMVAASHQNWKAQAEENKRIADRRLADSEANKREIAAIQSKLQQERVTRTMLVAQVESQWQQAKQLYESKEKEVIKALADLEDKTQILKEAEERLNEQDDLVANLDQENKTLIQNIGAEHSKLIELQNLRFELEGKRKALERTKAELSNSLAMAERVLKANNLSPESLTLMIPPILKGEVRAVREDLVEISLGTDDGLRQGHTVDIYRNGQFVGSASVYQESNNHSIVRIIPEMTNSAVQINDTVTTEWSRPVARNGQ